MKKNLEETLEFLCLEQTEIWKDKNQSEEYYLDDTEEDDDYYEREVQVGLGCVKEQQPAAQVGNRTPERETGEAESEYEGNEYDTYDKEPEYEEVDAYEDEDAYDEDEAYETEEYDDEKDRRIGRVHHRGGQEGRRGNPRQAGGIRHKIKSMDLIDRVVAITGVAILILAVVVGGAYASNRATLAQVASFEEIGTEMEGITVIGESGLLAMSDAQSAKAALEEAAAESAETEKEYEEKDLYEAGSIDVELHLSSMQKDLKIKFVNKKTGRLISSVPFEVDVATADQKKYVLKDEDMDGIIYQTDVAPGKCSVAMLEIEDAEEYFISTQSVSVTIKDKIEYKKVDVADEVKKESEVNAAVEDTKRQTSEESALADTVDWVEPSKSPSEETSGVISDGEYEEVSKDKITDPLTLVSVPADNVQKLGSPADAVQMSGTQTGEVPMLGSFAEALPILGTQTKEIQMQGSQTDGTQTDGTQTGADASNGGQTDTAAVQVTITVDCTSLTMKPGETYRINAATEPAGSYGAWASSNPAAATVQDGVVTAVAEGTTDITVTTDTGNSALCKVTVVAAVQAKPEIKISAASAKVFVGKTIQLSVEVTGVEDKSVTWHSNHDASALVAQDGTVTGISPGTAEIKAVCNADNTVLAACQVTVRTSPEQDTETRLKDNDGNQLYVIDSEGNFREAVYADYYTAEKFYKKGQGTQQGDYKYTGWQTMDGKTYYFDANGNKVTGEQVIQGVRYTFDSEGVLSTTSGTMGIDVSKWNGAIDWNAVKNAGVSYVIIRCGYRGSTTGALIEDPTFRTNIQGASSAGLKVGIYFFSQAVNEVEAVEEASMVAGLISGYHISYPVFLDVEPSGGRADGISREARTAVCRAFCQTIQNSGYTAGIYANSTWLREKIDTPSLTDYKIWLAQYAATATYHSTRYDMWQYSAKGKIAGINGDTDLNISYLGY